MSRWDDGIAWHLEDVVAPSWDEDPLTLAFVRDDHLRCANGSAEDDKVTRLIRTSYRQAERATQRALIPQTKALVMSRFPPGAGVIVVPRPPLLSIEEIAYVDPDGVEQTLIGSPEEYNVRTPAGPHAVHGTIWPLYDATWPETRTQPDAVVITFRCGYALAGSPAVADIPEDILDGRLLMIGELYKQRSESVHAFNQNPAIIRARDLWGGYRVYG